MNRREFIAVTSGAGLGLLASGCLPYGQRSASKDEQQKESLKLLPYPKEIVFVEGSLQLGPPVSDNSQSGSLALDFLKRHFPSDGGLVPVRLGSVEEGYDKSWLTTAENDFLAEGKGESSVVVISPTEITVVGHDKQGMLYGVQTICQLAINAARENRKTIPCLRIRDWPDMKWRCLAPTLTWYSGWNRLEGYDLCNWTEDEWKWLVDWSVLHKCNTWAVCMYGYWPFTLPNYEKETLDVDSAFYNPAIKRKQSRRFVHRNIRHEFFSKVIKYANERGIKVHAYIGKNSFNGANFKFNHKIFGGGASELLPFAPGVDEYWDAFIGRILETGFNGFVFEDPEANHVPNQNEKCYQTFWQPWAAKYGYSSVEQTDQNRPPLGVHVEYYAWLYKQFSEKISRHAQRLGTQAEKLLISHVLLARIMSESKSPEERREWISYIDQKQGDKVRFIITESNEKDYVELLGADRVASLGGRGGSCTNAMRRIASVNNNCLAGAMGGDLAYERDCQRRIFQAGGFGAMGYIFEWTNTEVFGYLAAQYLWNNAGIPGVNNSDQVGILDYAYRIYYGDEVGRLVARAMDEGSDVNDAMVLEHVYGSQYPSTGKPLHRDYQFLAVLADHAEELARQAYQLYTGRDPELFKAAYSETEFVWNGYNAQADHLFKEERLRKLWLSTRRSQEICQTALAHRRSQRLLAEGAPVEIVLQELDRAVGFAKQNQLIYQLNYDDNYDWTDGLCYKVTERLMFVRQKFLTECEGEFPNPAEARSRVRPNQRVPELVRQGAEQPVLFIPWEKIPDILPAKTDSSTFYLQTRIGCVAREDYFRLGVVFTVEMQESGVWIPLFRRSLQRRVKDWEQWQIPVPVSAGNKKLRLRFITDSYSRAQDRNAPLWTWALWGNPRLLRDANPIYEFGKQMQNARPKVRLDADGKDRPFDKNDEDSTGAAFKVLTLDATAAKILKFKEQHKQAQWLDGFSEWAGTALARGDYRSYLGLCPSQWTYGVGDVVWLTATPKSQRDTFIVFVGSTDFPASEAEIRVNDAQPLPFQTGLPSDQHWQGGNLELFYYHGEVMPNVGISGVYVLRVPASMMTAGRAIKISLRLTKLKGWVMCHGYRNVLQMILNPTPVPSPVTPVIAAFTPHLGEQFGLTIGEYEIDL